MEAITLTILDNADLKIAMDNETEFQDILSREFCDERHFLTEMMESAGYIGNDWDCLYNIGLTEAHAIGQGVIYSDCEDDEEYSIDFENVWYFKNYMTLSYIEILKEEGSVIFKRHQDNLIKQKDD